MCGKHSRKIEGEALFHGTNIPLTHVQMCNKHVYKYPTNTQIQMCIS